jgi:hypothetical protein
MRFFSAFARRAIKRSRDKKNWLMLGINQLLRLRIDMWL